VVKAQATTTKRTQITVEQQLRWKSSESLPVKPVDAYFTWKPQELMEAYKANKNDAKLQKQLFEHICNHVARECWKCRAGGVEPSPALNVDVSDDQRSFLNPSYIDVVTGFILYDCKGNGAVKKIARRRLEMISGNVASYSRLLNDEKRLEEIKEVHELTSAVAAVSADMENSKKRKAEKAVAEEEKKRQRKKQDKEEAAKKKERSMPTIKVLMDKFEKGEVAPTPENFSKMNASDLKLILLYYFDYEKGVSTWKKDKLAGTVAEKFAARESTWTKSVTEITANTTDNSAHLPINPSDNTNE
jgi:hypothetical protein